MKFKLSNKSIILIIYITLHLEAIMDNHINMIIFGENPSFVFWQRVYTDIYNMSKKNPELVRTTYKIWSNIISLKTETSMLEEKIQRLNNIFSYPIKNNIIKKAGDLLKKRELLLGMINTCDIINLTIQPIKI